MSTVSMIRKVLAHPFDFYEDIQSPGRIKWIQGVVIVLLTFVAKMLSIMLTGYAFQTNEPHEISMLHEFIWIIVPWLTWCVSNWGVSTILDGEGRFKEIFVGSAFALVPYMLFVVPVTLLTLVLSLEEASIYKLGIQFLMLWVGWLFLVKVKTIHDFSLKKVVIITIISLIGIGIIWFVGILLFGIANQFIAFMIDLFKEMRLR